MNQGFWRGKRVLVTGHTGFKGSWLSLLLARAGARVTGIALAPDTSPNLHDAVAVGELVDGHFQDIRDPASLATLVEGAAPEIVFHLAAQPLVREGYKDPLATFGTNVQGTANLLQALRGCDGLRVVVVATTDKVYRNRERLEPYAEDDELGGHDPYSASKAAAELVTASFRDSFLSARGIAVATARAGNVIGGGDWSIDRLIPDALRAWSAGEALRVRRPEAVRPWQHVLEPLHGYLLLAERLWHDSSLAGAYNFGPPPDEVASVREVIELARATYGAGEIEWGDGSEGPHEAGLLTLDTTKAARILRYRPRWALDIAVRRSMTWYRRHAKGESARDLCEMDVREFQLANHGT